MSSAVLTERDAFLDAILANPDDDAPRLMYADWLQENGEPERGEFIKVQCEIARLKPPGKSLLRRRQRELLRKRRAALWFPIFPNRFFEVRNGNYLWYSGIPHNHAHIRRGFVDEVHCATADWLKHGPVIVRQQPVRVVRLTDKETYSLSTQSGKCAWMEENIIGMRPLHKFELPTELCFHLNGRWEMGLDSFRVYATPELAHADLSIACLMVAKEEVARV